MKFISRRRQPGQFVIQYWSSSVDIGQRLGCLHRSNRCLSTCSNSFPIKEVPLLYFSVIPIHSTTFRNVPKSIDFHQTDGCNSCSSASACHVTFSVPRQLAHKRSYMRQTNISHNILSPNGFIPNLKKVRFEPSLAIHLYRYGISDTNKSQKGLPLETKNTQNQENRRLGLITVVTDTTRSYGIFILTITQFLTQTQVSARTFLSLLGKLNAAADLVVLGKLHLCLLQVCLLSVWTCTSFGSSNFF